VRAFLDGNDVDDLRLDLDLRAMIGLATQCGFFTPGGAEFSPLDLTPALWLDASDASTLYDATTGGSLVAADGLVARWQDKSGNSRHATQATSGSRPQRKTAIQNSLDVVRFDGTRWMATVAFSGSQAFERYVVCNDRSSPSQSRVILAWGSGYDTPNPGADYLLNTGRVLQVSHNGGGGVGALSHRQTGQVFNGSTFIYLSQRSDGTHAGHLIRVNGAQPSQSSPFSNNPGTFTKTSTACGIGAYNNGGLPVIGDIGEVVHFNRVLTTDERLSMETYLGEKWALP
jgi:hypothetical protein